MSDQLQLVDWDQFDMIGDGFDDDFIEIYHEFQDDLPRILDQIEAGLQANDPVAVSKAAHQVKGSAANFGFVGFTKAALAMEQAGKAGSLNGVPESLESARNLFRRSIEAVKTQRGL